MKKLLASLLLCAAVLSFFSCGEQRSAYKMLSEFVSSYGAQGVIYSPEIPEGESGYIRDGLVEKIYIYSGRFPDNFAIFLNSRADFGSECGVFVCSDADTLQMMEEACLERIRLLGRGNENAFVKRSGSTVFYSTMKDKSRAEGIWREIIR